MILMQTKNASLWLPGARIYRKIITFSGNGKDSGKISAPENSLFSDIIRQMITFVYKPVSMKSSIPDHRSLVADILKKGVLKQEVYHKTLDIFNQFREECGTFVNANKHSFSKGPYPLLFEFSERGTFEFQLKFGSDILIFFMHSNVFEIPRDHLVMKSGYIKEDKTRSYCGIIHIFNFLADSFKYNRTTDVGYCIGRVFVNREGHYFTEGKREIGLIYNNFANHVLDRKAIGTILRSSILYTLNFDLLTPPFETVREVTVAEMQTALDAISVSTGKRLGFRFQADTE